jgi:solute:Na+ symporter, SSS family
MKFIILVVALLLTVFSSISSSQPQPVDYLQWSVHSTLPPTQAQEVQPGLAGNFAGVIGNYIMVAGGANFPEALPWEGGQRVYSSDVFLLPLGGSKEWVVREDALPRPLGYGVSITLPDGVLFIGGANSDGVFSEVFQARIQGPQDDLVFIDWPELPVPLTNMTGALVGNTIFIAGGQEQLAEPAATNHFFSLDTKNPERGWIKRSPWPGPSRSFSVSAAQNDGFDAVFYLFSGRNYGPDRPLEILKDGYEYNPRLDRWKRLDGPDGPDFPLMAGLAFASGQNHIILIGGDDGSLMIRQKYLEAEIDRLTLGGGVAEDALNGRVDSLNALILHQLNNHPGFRRDILYYHTITNTLVKAGEAPFPFPVTTNVVKAEGRYFITSGEARPGVRTPDVYVGWFVSKINQSLGWLNITVITIYFLILLWIGWFFSKRQKNTDDYFRGGKRIPWWAVGMSIFGTALSAITFMAIPAKTYATDWSYLWLNVGILAVAPVIVYLCIPFYRSLDITSAYEYLEKRFNLIARLIGSAAFILFQIGRMGVVLFLPAIALNVVTGLDVFLCIALMGVFSLAYTMLGGIEAVIWTDALQVVVLLGGAFLAVITIAFQVDGGMAEIISIGVAESKFHLGDLSADFKNPVLLTVVIAGIFAPLITYGTDQVMVQRYMTTSTEKMAGKSVWTNAFLTIPATLIFFFVGTALFVFYMEKPLLLNPTISGGDAIFPWFIISQMPPGVVGLLISGLFAAAMSTLSSSMSSAATAYTIDMHFRLGLPSRMDHLKLARIVTFVLGAAGIATGFLMATLDIVSLWDQFQLILGLILGGIGGLFFLGMLTKRANGPGAILGLAGSTLFQAWVYQNEIVHLLIFTATGFISCFVIGYLASFLFRSELKEITHLTIYGIRQKNEDKSS